MPRDLFRFAWIVSLLLAATLACNFISGIGQDIRQAQQTGQAVFTEVQAIITENAPALETASAFATREGGSILETARAIATDNPGLLDTARAFATEGLPELRETLEAIATDHPELAETLRSIATDRPDVLETLKALATRYAGGSGSSEIPADIPLVDESTIQDLNVMQGLISFNTTLDFKTVVDFYQQELPANGWEANEDASMVSGSTALLAYTKVDRSATLIITGDISTELVSVVIQIGP